jgi:hypothetical protein
MPPKPTLAKLLGPLLRLWRPTPAKARPRVDRPRKGPRPWTFRVPGRPDLQTVMALTRSEARAGVKARLGIPRKGRLPVGSRLVAAG